MVVLPSHSILDGHVKIPKTVVLWNEDPPPYVWLNITKLNLYLIYI